jgi:hypothetical protein
MCLYVYPSIIDRYVTDVHTNQNYRRASIRKLINKEQLEIKIVFGLREYLVKSKIKRRIMKRKDKDFGIKI